MWLARPEFARRYDGKHADFAQTKQRMVARDTNIGGTPERARDDPFVVPAERSIAVIRLSDNSPAVTHFTRKTPLTSRIWPS